MLGSCGTGWCHTVDQAFIWTVVITLLAVAVILWFGR